MATGQQMGRGIAMCGHHAAVEELPAGFGNALATGPERSRTKSFDLPGWVLNPLSIGAFNALYFWREGKNSSLF